MFRVGNHWGRTIVREGSLAPDQTGRRPDDELVGVMFDTELAVEVIELLNKKIAGGGHAGTSKF